MFQGPCEDKHCGSTCIVEGDMAGMCNAKKECSFDYDNLGCTRKLHFMFSISHLTVV